MLRRAFIAMGSILFLSASTRAQKADTNKLLVLDQSGIFGHPDFIFGSWLISNETITRNELYAIKKSTKYRRRLSYRSTDKYKKRFAEGATKYILKKPNNLVRLVSFKPNPQQSLSKYADRYLKFLIQEIETTAPATESFTIICQRRFSGDLDRKIREKLISQIPNLKDVVYKKEREELLIQCLGQVTGSANAFLEGYANTQSIDSNWKPNKTKEQLKLFLARVAQLSSLWIPKRHSALVLTTRYER